MSNPNKGAKMPTPRVSYSYDPYEYERKTNAIKVVVFDPKIRAFLLKEDPMAFKQLISTLTLGECTPEECEVIGKIIRKEV